MNFDLIAHFPNISDVELTAAEALKDKTGYVDLQEVSRGEPTPEPIPAVDDENCSEDEV